MCMELISMGNWIYSDIKFQMFNKTYLQSIFENYFHRLLFS